MFYHRFSVLAVALFTCVGQAYASPGQSQLQPHTPLNATLQQPPGPATTFSSAFTIRRFPVLPVVPEPLFPDQPAPDRGWQAFANVLAALAPSADTRLPPSASEITQRIRLMVDQGRYDQALDAIAKREAQRESQGALGTDVQLMFLKARALGGAGHYDQSTSLYLYMTTQYPELPEPWNNLALDYVRQNRLAEAEDALRMALTAQPNYTPARNNLGLVQLLQARETLATAAQAGSTQAARELQRLEAALQ